MVLVGVNTYGYKWTLTSHNQCYGVESCEWRENRFLGWFSLWTSFERCTLIRMKMSHHRWERRQRPRERFPHRRIFQSNWWPLITRLLQISKMGRKSRKWKLWMIIYLIENQTDCFFFFFKLKIKFNRTNQIFF